MIFKNKLIIYIAADFISPHNLNIHHLENWRDISGGNVRWWQIYPDFVLSLCHRNALSLYNGTTVNMLCPVMDGAYLF